MSAIRATTPEAASSAAPAPTWSPERVESGRLKILLHAIGMAKYRVPVYAELARRPGVDLEVQYTQVPMLQNAEPQGFRASKAELKIICKRPWLFYQPSRLRSVRNGSNRPDVVILPWDLRYVSLVPTIRRARRSGIGIVLWGHGYSKNPSWWRTFLRNAVAKMGDCVMLYHASAMPPLLRSGMDPNRIFIAPNSIDQQPVQKARDEWMKDPNRLLEFRRRHGLDTGPVILFVARFMQERRVDVMFEAMALLGKKFPMLQAVLIGGGPEEANLRTLAEKLGFTEVDREGRNVNPGAEAPSPSPRVRFLGPIYDEDQLAPWFMSSQAMCFPAHLGLSVLHAFGYGLPVVTSDNPMVHGPEFAALKDCENGKLFRLNDHQDLARSLYWVLSDPQRLEQLSRAALRAALEDYNVPRMVDGMLMASRYAAEAARMRRMRSA